MGKNKEVLDAKLWGISKTLKIALKKIFLRKLIGLFMVFSDSQAAIKQLQCSKCNVGQALKIYIHNRARQLQIRGREVIIRWIPSHSEIEGNKQADKAVKEAATNRRTQTTQWSSLSHLKQKIIEAKNLEICSWH